MAVAVALEFSVITSGDPKSVPPAKLPITIGPALGELERDPSEGLGLVVVVTSSPATDAWRRTERIVDPTLTRIGVFTAGSQPGRLNVDASSVEAFRTNWGRLAGTGGLHRIVRDGEIVTEVDAGAQS